MARQTKSCYVTGYRGWFERHTVFGISDCVPKSRKKVVFYRLVRQKYYLPSLCNQGGLTLVWLVNFVLYCTVLKSCTDYVKLFKCNYLNLMYYLNIICLPHKTTALHSHTTNLKTAFTRTNECDTCNIKA